MTLGESMLLICIAGTAFLGGVVVGRTVDTPCPNAEGKKLMRDSNGVCEYAKAGYGRAVWVHYKREGVAK